MKKALFLSILGILIAGCIGQKEQLYNCYTLNWYRVHAENYEIPHPDVYIKDKWKSKKKDEAKQLFQDYMALICGDNSKIETGFYCKDRTGNSFIHTHRAIQDSKDVSSMFCIPVEMDTEGLAEKYVEENIEPEGGVKGLFPLDNN